MTSTQLRAAIELERPHCARDGFSPELRSRVARYARHQRAAGARWTAVAVSLGISRPTLRNWLSSEPATSIVAVRVVPDDIAPAENTPATSSSCLVSPRGYRVEGLSVEALVELLERLG